MPFLVRLPIEWACGIASAGLVAPVIAVIDQAIVANASGAQSMGACIQENMKLMVTRPQKFFRQPSVWFIWGVYSGTYVVANTVQSYCEFSRINPFYPKFVGSSIANVTLSVLKDKAFARMFGSGPPRPLPVPSYGLFAMRDSMTILASFSLPPLFSARLQKQGVEKGKADFITQLATPVGMQIFSVPLHLLGLDLYNNPDRPGLGPAAASGRINFIRKEYMKTLAARMARIFPAFGCGGVVNKYLREESGKKMNALYNSK